MLPEEDEAPQSDHSVELVSEIDSPFPPRRRRIAQVAVVGCMLAASGLIALAFVEHWRALDEERTLEAVQSTQLQDGWKTLGTLASEQARAADAQNTQNAAAQPVAAPTVAVPTPATTNIVIVNPPAQQAARAPVTVDAPAAPSVAVPVPGVSNGTNTVYVPTPVLPNTATGTDIPGQNVSNGSIPGSTPNPALPNGSTTSEPNVPSTPVGSVPASPPTTGITP